MFYSLNLHSKFDRVKFTQIEENFTLCQITFGPSLKRVKVTLLIELFFQS